MTKTALLLGGTGLIGGHLLKLLINDPEWDRIVALTRRPLGTGSGKIIDVIGDPVNLDNVASELVADTVFCCLGTTHKKAGSREAFRRIDYDYVLHCAEIAHRNGAKRFLLVSSIGAKAGSPSYYSHVKGEVERDLAAVGFETLDILQPSLLLGERKEHRFMEDWAGRILPALSFFLAGPLRKYRPIEAEQVARAMHAIAAEEQQGIVVYQHDKLNHFG